MRVLYLAAIAVLSFNATVAFAADHHSTLSFTLAPGASKTFALPAKSVPVRLSASLTAKNGATQTPCALIDAVINEDASSNQLTWIGTNGDGSQGANNTLSSSTVANFAFSNATLSAAAGGTLTITQNAATTSIPFTYHVTMDY